MTIDLPWMNLGNPDPANVCITIMTGDTDNWIELKADGSVKFGPSYNADELAKVFWETVARNRPK